jgi:hypothetical protein
MNEKEGGSTDGEEEGEREDIGREIEKRMDERRQWRGKDGSLGREGIVFAHSTNGMDQRE